jgi:hypothetical protein
MMKIASCNKKWRNVNDKSLNPSFSKIFSNKVKLLQKKKKVKATKRAQIHKKTCLN